MHMRARRPSARATGATPRHRDMVRLVSGLLGWMAVVHAADERPAGVPPARVEQPGTIAPEVTLDVLRQAAEDALQTVLGAPAADVLAQRLQRTAAEAQQRELVRRQAKQFEQLLQPLLRSELELVRRACGDVSEAARRDVLAAGRAAIESLAEEAAARQMNGGVNVAEIDPRAGLHRVIAAAVAPHVPPARLAAYRREDQARLERRATVARQRIVAKLDEQLELSATQRDAILSDLEAGWQPSWIRELDDRGGLVVNNHPPAPDYAEERIVPHLDGAQRSAWHAWCRAAGSRMLGQRARWHFDGPGLPPDPWWEHP